jgi:hypothetical protein
MAIAATSPPVSTKSPEAELLVDEGAHPLVEALVAAADQRDRGRAQSSTAFD